MRHLHVGMSRPAVRLVNANFTQDFARFEGRRQHINKELVGLDRAFTILAGCDHLSVERDDCRWPVTGRVGVRDTAANCAFVSDLHIANV